MLNKAAFQEVFLLPGARKGTECPGMLSMCGVSYIFDRLNLPVIEAGGQLLCDCAESFPCVFSQISFFSFLTFFLKESLSTKSKMLPSTIPTRNGIKIKREIGTGLSSLPKKLS